MSVEMGAELQDEEYAGSLYVLPEQGGESAAAATKFKNSLREAQEQPIQVIDFVSTMASAYGRNHTSLTQGCVEVLYEEVRDAPHTYIYTHDAEIAKRLEPLVQMLISRTSIAESSAHQVFFAKISNEHDQVRMAVKPFTKAPEKAITDWTNTMLARTSGLHTFLPLGFMISGGVGYTFTERQDDIDPLDNVDWTRALIEPERSKNMIEDLMKMGPALARLHDAGIFHGDPQMKNGVLTQTGSMHWIDWESTTFILRSGWQWSPETTALIQHKTVRDLRVLFSSLAKSLEKQGVGLLHGQTPQTQLYYFKQLILDPYMEERETLLEYEVLESAEAALAHLIEVEQEITDYIANGDLYRSLQRTRQSTE